MARIASDETLKLFNEETSDVSNLVYQAVYEADALTLPAEGVDIDLLIDSPPGGDWMYQLRVSFPADAEFALCNPYREEYKRTILKRRISPGRALGGPRSTSWGGPRRAAPIVLDLMSVVGRERLSSERCGLPEFPRR